MKTIDRAGITMPARITSPIAFLMPTDGNENGPDLYDESAIRTAVAAFPHSQAILAAQESDLAEPSISDLRAAIEQAFTAPQGKCGSAVAAIIGSKESRRLYLAHIFPLYIERIRQSHDPDGVALEDGRLLDQECEDRIQPIMADFRQMVAKNRVNKEALESLIRNVLGKVRSKSQSECSMHGAGGFHVRASTDEENWTVLTISRAIWENVPFPRLV